MAIKWIFSLLCLLCLQTSGEADQLCPTEAVQRAMLCVGTKFPTAAQASGYAIAWDYHRMKDACVDGTISMSVYCVQDIIRQCRHNEEQTRLLHKYFDVERMENAMQLLCQRLDEAREYMPCMQEQLRGFERCAEDKLGVFEERAKLAGGNRDRIVEASCSFINKVYGCQTTAVRRHCGEYPARFQLRIMNAFRPPSCHEKEDLEYWNSGNFRLRLSVIVFIYSLMTSLLL